MKYSKLAELYQELSSTTKRLEKTDILSKFLKQVKKEDKECLYLILGDIYPEYIEKKIGISNQLAIKAISTATGNEKEKVVKEWKNIGDLGEVSEKLTTRKSQSTLQSHILDTKKVLENLRKLPELEGKGTVGKKLSLITELLTSASPIEAKYLVRTLIGDLRIGVKESTIRDSLARAFFKQEKDSGKKIQGAIDKSNDIVKVFEIAKKGKLKSLEQVSLEVGKPIKAMLAQKAKTIEDGFKAVGKPAACFPKGELIFTNPAIKEIENLNKKELVIGKDGKYQNILETFEREYNGDIIKISPNYLLSFALTPEHKILAIKKELCSWKNRKITCRPNCQEQKYGCIKKYKNYKTEWIEAGKLEKGDFILFPKFKQVQETKIVDLVKFNRDKRIEEKENKIRTYSNHKGTFKGKWINRFIELSPEFFELMGWYLAEGNSEKRGAIRFSLGYKEIQEAKRIKKLIKEIFGLESKINANKNKGIRIVRTHSNLISNFLRENFNTLSTNKKIPDFVIYAEPEEVKEFIKAYIKGDGHKMKNNYYVICTASKKIAYQIILLLSKLGILPSVGKYKNKGLGDVIYRISIFGKQINKLEENSHKYPTHHQRFFEDEKFFYIPIKKIEKYPYIGKVFNIETEDNTYLSSAIVHNCEYKYDGFRLIIHKKDDEVILFTRRLDNVTKQFPDVVNFIKKYVQGKSFILDTEAVGYHKKTKEYTSFQHISQRIRRKYNIEKLEKELPIEINIFDILYYEGKSLLNEPFEKRTALIKKIIKNHPYKIIRAKQIITGNEKRAKEFYKKALKDNQEGIMMKNLKAVYQPGSRVGHMLKVKPEERDLDLVIMGAEYGTGKRSGWMSSFILGCKGKKQGEFLKIGKMGTGIKELAPDTKNPDDASITFKELTERLTPLITKEKGKTVEIKPKIVISVTYQEIQRSPNYESGFALRFPRFTALREDKPVSEIADLKEIEKNFKNQKRNYQYG